MKAKDQQELRQVDKDGSKRRQRKAELSEPPPLEKGPWVIRRPPGMALLAELAPKQAEAHEEIRVLQREIEVSAKRHKDLKHEKEEEIEEIEERLDKLSQEVRFGTTSTVTCWRGREGDEWVYYGDKDGNNELWREPAADGVQQRLCGKEVAPAYRAYDAAKDGTVEELLARAKSFVAPPCELSEVAECELAPWPWGELSWHPFVLARQLELRELQEAANPPADDDDAMPDHAPQPQPDVATMQRDAAIIAASLLEANPQPAPQPPVEDDDEPDPDSSRDGRPEHDYESDFPEPPPATEPPPEPEADHAPPTIPAEQLPPAGTTLPWRTCKGEHGQEYHAGSSLEGYVIRRDPGRGKQLCVKYHNVSFGIERQLPWSHLKVTSAKAEAQQDNDTRLRWPGDVASGLLLDSTGRYQLSRYTVPGPNGEMWLTQHLPGQDQPAIGLGDHPLAEAIAACQADADRRREG